jgi:hypothetical protein
MRGPDGVAMRCALHRRVTIAFALCVGTLLLAETHSAMAQVGYTGVPLPPLPDTYIGTYVGPASSVGTVVAAPGPLAASVPQDVVRRPASVANSPLDGAVEATAPRQRGVITGWDLATIGALGLTAVIAFALSAGRFRRY